MEHRNQLPKHIFWMGSMPQHFFPSGVFQGTLCAAQELSDSDSNTVGNQPVCIRFSKLTASPLPMVAFVLALVPKV